MNSRTDGRKATIVWRAVHLMTTVAVVGILASVTKPESANGIGIIVGSVVTAIGGAVAVYVNSQGRVDVAETAHGPHPRRTTQTQAVQE